MGEAEAAGAWDKPPRYVFVAAARGSDGERGTAAHSPDGLPAGGDAKHRAVQAAARSAGNPAPFAQAEDYEAHPPKIAGDDEPVYV